MTCWDDWRPLASWPGAYVHRLGVVARTGSPRRRLILLDGYAPVHGLRLMPDGTVAKRDLRPAHVYREAWPRTHYPWRDMAADLRLRLVRIAHDQREFNERFDPMPTTLATWRDVPSAPGYTIHPAGFVRTPSGHTITLEPRKQVRLIRATGGTNRSPGALWRECFGDESPPPWESMTLHTRNLRLQRG